MTVMPFIRVKIQSCVLSFEKKASMWLTLGSSRHIIFGWKFSKPFAAVGVVFFQSHFLLIQHIGTPPPDKSFHFAGGMASKSHIIAERQ